MIIKSNTKKYASFNSRIFDTKNIKFLKTSQLVHCIYISSRNNCKSSIGGYDNELCCLWPIIQPFHRRLWVYSAARELEVAVTFAFTFMAFACKSPPFREFLCKSFRISGYDKLKRYTILLRHCMHLNQFNNEKVTTANGILIHSTAFCSAIKTIVLQMLYLYISTLRFER